MLCSFSLQLIFFFRTAVLRKLFDIRFSYKHCNFSHVCLLVKMASKTVTRSINFKKYERESQFPEYTRGYFMVALHIFGQGRAKIKKNKTKQNILSRFFFQSELRMIATPKVKMVSMNTLNSFFFIKNRTRAIF